MLYSKKVIYLGHLINQDGVQPDAELVRAVMKWEVPRNKRELQNVLEFVNYYKAFIKNYAVIAAPMQHLARTKGMTI